MKTQPSKLLLALAVCFSMAAAHAEGDNNSKNSRSNKDTSGKSSNTVVTTGCTSTVQATACGPVQVTTCATSGSTTAAAITTAQKNKDSERHKDDGKDRGDGKDHNEYSHGDNSKYSGRDSSKDDGDDNYGRPYGYHWEQSNNGGVKQRKVTICHREGGARTTIDVDDDGRYHGHHNDPMDTLGACEDQDDKTGKHTDNKNKGRDVHSIYKAATCGTVRPYAVPDANKHHKDEDHAANDADKNSRFSKRDKTKDDSSGYRWEHDKDGNAGTSNDRQRKVTVCHRMGNARVTLDVDDDGWYHGHDKHVNDTLGACEDQDDKTRKYTKGNLSGQKPASLVSDPSCASTTTTTGSAACTAAGGVAGVLGGLGCGGAGVSCAPLATGTRPMRGGLRNVR